MGSAFEDKRLSWLNLDFYYFGLHDQIPSGSTVARRYQTFGARALRAALPGQWDYELELMGQFGDRTLMRTGVKTRLDQKAYGGHAELGYTFVAPWSPRLAAQFDYASGSPDPDGDESGTFDPLYGGRRSDLNVTGIYGPFRRSNILSPGVRLQLVPRSDLKAFLKLRYWRLAQEKDAFVGNGLSDPSGRAGSNLGTDLELSVQWTPKPWLVLETGYDHWWKGSYVDRVPTPAAGPVSTEDADYFYFSVLFRI